MSTLVQLGAVLNKHCFTVIACVLLYLGLRGGRTGDLANPVVKTLWNIIFYLSEWWMILFHNNNSYYRQFFVLSTLLSPFTLSTFLLPSPLCKRKLLRESGYLADVTKPSDWGLIWGFSEHIPSPAFPQQAIVMSLGAYDNCHSFPLVLTSLAKLSHFGEVVNLWDKKHQPMSYRGPPSNSVSQLLPVCDKVVILLHIRKGCPLGFSCWVIHPSIKKWCKHTTLYPFI